jgi:3-methylcrotonyl-CoA carboxylase alpha subunit
MKPLFEKILIANRGEIACRVMTTAKRLGIKTVAVYSDADRHSPHVLMADEAFRLGPSPANESYLRGELILQIAQQTGAQAIHPGYGFLSENDQFAQDCERQGIVFVGPPASAIAAMGSKSAAKTLMAKAGVPLVPGYHGDQQEPAFLRSQASQFGYPVLIKASAGGGGKGMRIVADDSEFLAALASCQREAKSSFGNQHVLLERYLTKPRHIEVQVFADTHGQCLYLFERDCSVQRRHQKVVEEAPAPGMTQARREQMGEAAVAAARAVGYVGAGTVEFIAQPSGEFFFMEMNTRLQVEHPVTEAITGLDLVHWQLLAAAGQPLPLTQQQLTINGHAIETRIYAENTAKQFLPAIGPIHHLRTPSAVRFEVGEAASSSTPASVRIDSGILEGGQISPFYDPMIAKLIVWGPTRAQAIERMHSALEQFEVAPLVTNISFLKSLMRCASFVNADLDTGLIDREREFLFAQDTRSTQRHLVIAIAAQLASEAACATADPWSKASGWRHFGGIQRDLALSIGETSYQAAVEYAPQGYSIELTNDDQQLGQPVCLSDVALHEDKISGTIGNTPFFHSIVAQPNGWIVFDRGSATTVTLIAPLAFTASAAETANAMTAPMPGKIVALLVAPGVAVKSGQPLLVMEAMKMEHTICAPRDAVLKAFIFAVGDPVTEGANLIELSETGVD